MTSVEVRVLGPVEVVGPGGPAVLSGSRQRAVLGLLALTPGATVGRSRLIDALWGEDPPRTALKTLYSYVTRVRQALDACGLPGALVVRGTGYSLDVPALAVDAVRFEAEARRAAADLEAGSPGPAARRLASALDLWRGEALADAEPSGWAVAEVARLHELRLTALEDRWDAELRLGRHRAVVAELERLVRAEPLRERLVGLHMLALYRSGRQVQALESYQRLRDRLADDLGVDPGADLQRLHVDILRRAPGLDRPAEPPAPTRPAELPAPVGHFTGRVGELSILDRLSAEASPECPIVVVSGPAGMGKTALAVQFAHQVKDRFGDGQLFLDLRGHDPAVAMPAVEALGQILRSLGVPPERIPAQPVEQAGLGRPPPYRPPR